MSAASDQGVITGHMEVAPQKRGVNGEAPYLNFADSDTSRSTEGVLILAGNRNDCIFPSPYDH